MNVFIFYFTILLCFLSGGRSLNTTSDYQNWTSIQSSEVTSSPFAVVDVTDNFSVTYNETESSDPTTRILPTTAFQKPSSTAPAEKVSTLALIMAVFAACIVFAIVGVVTLICIRNMTYLQNPNLHLESSSAPAAQRETEEHRL